MDPALRALNRFGLGARPDERGALGDTRSWLTGQLRPARALLEGPGLPTAEEAAEVSRSVQAAQRDGDRDSARRSRRELAAILEREARAALTRRVGTDAPFLERLVAFWSNHLCVSVAAKQQLLGLAGLYEREAIRPHVLGRFADMVLASARHPAMLLYLDNAQSIGPGSPGARIAAARRGRERGLNENYARELLELHTLGVDGGYGQADVEALARLLTGWTLSGLGPAAGGARAFTFRPALHDPGAKELLGTRYDRGGQEEGEEAIRDLCAHPATARFVATKLVRHFVADDPPPRAVAAVASVFAETEGDLGAVSRALVSLEEAWDPRHRKLRSPQDWLVASLRALGAREAPEAAMPLLRQLRHPLWSPPSPKGFGDRKRDWADPDGLMNRAELARSIARRSGVRGGGADRLLDTVDVARDDPLVTLVADRSVGTGERVALVLASPTFQWR